MNRKVKSLAIVAIAAVILFGAVSVYAGNGAGRAASSRQNSGHASGQTTRATDTTRDADCDEDCTNESYAVNAGSGNRNGDGGTIADYAELTGTEWRDVIDAMHDSDLTIWELAEQQGNFAALKAAVLADLDARSAVTTDAETLAELTAHRDAIAAATTAAEMPEDYDGYESSDGGRYGQSR